MKTLQDTHETVTLRTDPPPPHAKLGTYLSGGRRHVHRLELPGRPSSHKLELELPRDFRLLAHQL